MTETRGVARWELSCLGLGGGVTPFDKNFYLELLFGTFIGSKVPHNLPIFLHYLI